MTRPSVAVFAYSEVGHACLELLLQRGANVVRVFTYADAPDETIWFPSVRALADGRGISTRIVALERPVSGAEVAALGPDLIFSFYYRDLLPAAVLSQARLGAYNMHGSLLPAYRGRAPVNWAVLRGETRTGATLHCMTGRADAGDIVDQEPVPIGPDDSAADVQRRVTLAAVTILERQLPALEAGTAPRTPQDEQRASKFGRRRPEDGRIDWTRPARDVHNLVRAVTHPFPGAYAEIPSGRIHVWRSDAGDEPSRDPPGTWRGDGGRLRVTCGDGRYLELTRVQPAGEPEIDGSAMARRLRDFELPRVDSMTGEVGSS